ncbi:MAG: hypothetical protein R2698_08845 [Microthrixaceae bacterium]
MGLDLAVAEGLMASDTAACWTREKAALAVVESASRRSSPTEQDRSDLASALTDLAKSMQCLEPVLDARPTDVARCGCGPSGWVR